MPPTADHPLADTPWIESPFFEHILERRLASGALSSDLADEARRLHRDGFLAMDLAHADFDAVAQRIITDMAPHYEGKTRFQDSWCFQADVRALANHPAIIDRLRLFYGREPIPFQTLNFQYGSEQPLHSDAAHFSSVPERFMVGVWIPLEDVDDDNGPLEYVPGSHRLPIITNEHVGGFVSENVGYHSDPAYLDAWEGQVTALGLTRQRFTTPRGRALIWAANLLHGGVARRDRARTRHSLVIHYYFADCVYHTPFLSDPLFGRVAYRAIRDIRTGAQIPNVYKGRLVPDLVMAALSPQAGINPITAPPVDPDAFQRRRPLLTNGARISTSNTPPGGYSRDGEVTALRPNPPGGPESCLIIDKVPLTHGTRFIARVAVGDTRAHPVVFTTRLVAPDGVEVGRWRQELPGGTARAWEITFDHPALTATPTPWRVVLSTAVTEGAVSAEHANAHWISPVLESP